MERFARAGRVGSVTPQRPCQARLDYRSRAEALAKARAQLAAGRKPEDVLDLLAHTLVNRLLHAPTAALREAALTGDAELARAAEKLFPPVDGEAANDSDGMPDSGRPEDTGSGTPTT